MGQIYGENTDLNGGTQVRVLGTSQKCQIPMHKKILDGYDDFNSYVVILSFRDTTNFERLDIQRYGMSSKASKIVSRTSHNNKNTTVLSTLFLPYLHESYKQLLS